MKKVTETVFAVYSEEQELFFGIDHCQYQNPDDIVCKDGIAGARELETQAKEYCPVFDWKIVKIEKSWEIVDGLETA